MKRVVPALAVCSAALLFGCGYQPPSYAKSGAGAYRAFSFAWIKERLTPRPLKKELYSTPNAYNQPLEKDALPEHLGRTLRELRNGTLEIRRKERKADGGEAQNPERYYASYDVNEDGFAPGRDGTPGLWGRIADVFRPWDNSPAHDTCDFKGKSSYGSGFYDGCRTYNAAVGVSTWQMIKPKFRPACFVKDANYQRGFNDGAHFCTYKNDWDMH
jgi:hypothetical protein